MLHGFDHNTFPMIRDEKEERFARRPSQEKMEFNLAEKQNSITILKNSSKYHSQLP
jgi:hypothetical protein